MWELKRLLTEWLLNAAYSDWEFRIITGQVWILESGFIWKLLSTPAVTTLLYLNTVKRTTWDTTRTTLLSHSIGNWPKSMNSDHFLSLLNSSLWMTTLCSWTRTFKYCSCAIGSSKQDICLVSDICNVILLVLVVNWARVWISINKSVSGSQSPSLLLYDDMFI